VTPLASTPRAGLHYAIALAWLIFTVSLASWWLAVGLTFPSRHRMFVYEGVTLLVMLVAGGATIVLAIRREHRRRQALETFFMSFTHDLKTALASVQLQAEGLREDWPDGAGREALDRLLRDTLRLQIQLENSLFVAQPHGRLLAERLDLDTAIRRLAQDWPDLSIGVHGSARIHADARAFDAVLRNVFQNAVVHGRADRADVQVEHGDGGRVRLLITDNGQGISDAELRDLGRPFSASGETGGSGVGLYVCSQLVKRMDGSMRFERAAGRGLRVIIEMPGGRNASGPVD
jgi:signal transduction histidine kinase